MKAQDFFLMAIPFLLASLALLWLRNSVIYSPIPYGEKVFMISIALLVTLFFAIGFLIAGIIKKLIAKLSPSASLLSSNKPA